MRPNPKETAEFSMFAEFAGEGPRKRAECTQCPRNFAPPSTFYMRIGYAFLPAFLPK